MAHLFIRMSRRGGGVVELLEGRRLLSATASETPPPPPATSESRRFQIIETPQDDSPQSEPPLSGTGFAGETIYLPGATTFRRFGGGRITARIDWGDGSAIERSDVNPMVIVDALATPGAKPQLHMWPRAGHVYAQDGAHTAVVTFRYHGRRIFREGEPVEVWPAAQKGASLEAVVGSPLEAAALGSFVDAGLSIDNRMVPWIDWGDATPSSAATFERTEDAAVRVTGSHTYEAAGTYRVCTLVRGLVPSPSDPMQQIYSPVAVLRSTVTVRDASRPVFPVRINP